MAESRSISFCPKVSQDTLLTHFYAYERHLRVADGPDEVHRNAIAKHELAAYL